VVSRKKLLQKCTGVHGPWILISKQNLFDSNFSGAAYQVRTWQGWHHLMALSLMAVWFLIGETYRGQQWTPALTLPQVRSGLSLLLLEVYYRPGADSICRQVQRQLLRNELARFYHHRTRKCIPPRKLRREIQ